MTDILLLLIVAFCVQSGFAFFQIKSYQKVLNEMKGKGLLGIGSQRGFRGDVVIVSYNRETKTIQECKRMKGVSVFLRFRRAEELIGLSLQELKEVAVKEHEKLHRKKKKEQNFEGSNARKKGALLQAVDALESRLEQEAQEQIVALEA